MAKKRRTWVALWDDDAFGAAFLGKTIVETGTRVPDEAPGIDADLFWKLSDGSWIAMHLADTSVQGCDTCGHGADEKAYYFLEA